MAVFGKKLRTLEGGLYAFWCPGCKTSHPVGPGWKFNGDGNAPTFNPSVLVRNGHYVPDFKPADNCWCKYNAEQEVKGEKPSRFRCSQCHSFVTAGRIQFLTDCTHELAGQTVDLPDFPG